MIRFIAVLAIVVSFVTSELEQDPFSGLRGVPDITFCNSTLTPLIVNSYSFTPDDIHSNENVTLTIFATLTETVSSGKIHVDVKIGPIPVYNHKLDLCTEVKQGGMQCPLKPTNYNITQIVPIPNIPIHGNVKASVELTDQSDKQLLCMDLKVHV
eukprot:307500_1